ncbi:acyltransferase [Citrobacter freundii]|uniref:acyltransferase n=1 Tax=Citrobacter freundii TaxID=546 RepID=UPI002DB5E83F|nr:acyltransferase [Citrobacter freundii]MEB6425292.1 acyltransferase [Citrobacter freundii]
MKNKISRFLDYPIEKKIEIIRTYKMRMKSWLFYSIFMRSKGRGFELDKPLKFTFSVVSVGDNVRIGPHGRIEGVNEYNGSVFTPHIIIEDNVTFEQRCHITAGGILTIGSGTTVSFDVMITDIDHLYGDVNTPIIKQSIVVKKTAIGKNCFLGAGCKIQAGTILGDNCIVGAGAIVRGKYENGSVIVGIPGRVVKYYDYNNNLWKKVDIHKNAES